MSSRDPMPSSAAVRLCSSLMVRRGARLGTAPGATLSASCPAWSSRFVVCSHTNYNIAIIHKTLKNVSAIRCVVAGILWQPSSLPYLGCLSSPICRVLR